MEEAKVIVEYWTLCYAVLLLLGGCTSEKEVEIPRHIEHLDNLTVYPADVSPESEIELIREQSFGSADNVLIGRLGSIGVDTLGRVFMEDTDNTIIHVFAPDGSHITQFGREGRGPGEFLEISSLQATKNRLFVYDRNQQRTVVFSIDSLTYEHNVNLAENRDQFEELSDAYLGNLYARSNDTFLITFSTSNISDGMSDWDSIENTALFYIIDGKGQITSEKLLETKSSIEILIPYGARRVGTPVAFTAELLTSFSNDGDIYVNWSDDFLIKVYNNAGEYKHAFYYPYEKVSLTTETALNSGIPEHIIENMPSMDLSDTWPALNSMLIDDENRLWVSSIVNDQEVYQWWVLDGADGSLLARFTWPRKKQIEVIKNGKLYTRERDEETGIEEIVRYDIEIKVSK